MPLGTVALALAGTPGRAGGARDSESDSDRHRDAAGGARRDSDGRRLPVTLPVADCGSVRLRLGVAATVSGTQAATLPVALPPVAA